MLKKGHLVVIKNRTIHEQGTITFKWRKKFVYYYNVQTDKGTIFEGLTTDSNMPCHIVENISLKLNNIK